MILSSKFFIWTFMIIWSENYFVICEKSPANAAINQDGLSEIDEQNKASDDEKISASQLISPSLDKPVARSFISYLDGIISSISDLKTNLLYQRKKTTLPSEMRQVKVQEKMSEKQIVCENTFFNKVDKNTAAISLPISEKSSMDSTNANIIANVSNTSNSLNSTHTSAAASFKFTCTQLKNLTSAAEAAENNHTASSVTTENSVIIVNSSTLLDFIRPSNSNLTKCSLVLFYVPWCVYSARMAPYYNALPRVYPQLDFIAVDASYFAGINSRFATISVPSLLFFVDGKPLHKFNSSLRTLEELVYFVSNVSRINASTEGLQPSELTLRESDWQGPLSSQARQDRDYCLIFAWVFLLIIGVFQLVRSSVGKQFCDRILNLWQEHQHLD